MKTTAMMTVNKTAAIIAAGGQSTRMNGPDKLLQLIGGTPVIMHAVSAFVKSHSIEALVIVAADNSFGQIGALLTEMNICKPHKVVSSGSNRADSILNGINALDSFEEKYDYIAVHDGARPFIKPELIDMVVNAAIEHGAAIPTVGIKDTVKKAENSTIVQTLPRGGLFAAQTPQVFSLPLYLSAVNKIELSDTVTDDSLIFELAGIPVAAVAGDYGNIKITTPEDLVYARALWNESHGGKDNSMPIKIGHGYDVHRFAKERKLILCGVEIPYESGLLGHSDADVAVHAMMDAILGAIALGDIGRHFPDADPKYKNADSIELLKKVVALAENEGYVIGNADITIIAEAPRLAPYTEAMREKIAANCKLFVNNINIKVTSEEKLGLKGDGIGAHCVCLLKKF